MMGSFPAGTDGIVLSHAFTEMGPGLPRPPKELVSNGPKATHSTPWPWCSIRDQNCPTDLRQVLTAFDTPDWVIKWDSGADSAPQMTQDIGSSHIEEWFHPALEGL